MRLAPNRGDAADGLYPTDPTTLEVET